MEKLKVRLFGPILDVKNSGTESYMYPIEVIEKLLKDPKIYGELNHLSDELK